MQPACTGAWMGRAISDMLQEGHRLCDATFHLRGGGVDGSGKRNNPGNDPSRRREEE